MACCVHCQHLGLCGSWWHCCAHRVINESRIQREPLLPIPPWQQLLRSQLVLLRVRTLTTLGAPAVTQQWQSAGETAEAHRQCSLHPHLHIYYDALVSLLVHNVHTHDQQDWLKGRETQGIPPWGHTMLIRVQRGWQRSWPVGFTVNLGNRTHTRVSTEVKFFLCFPRTCRFRKSSVTHSPAFLYFITHIITTTDSLTNYLAIHWNLSLKTQ